MLFANTSSGSSSYYWLGSQCVYANVGYAYFGFRSVNNGYVHHYSLYYSNGNTNNNTYGVRPAVSLKSDIKVDASGNLSL